jgi:hypothetical protein
MGGDPGLVLGSYSNGIGDRAGTKCLATSPGPLVVCSDYRPSGATTAKELHLTFDGQPYTTGKSTTCPAAGGTSVLVLTAGSHVMTIAEDPSYKFTAVIS